MNTFQAMRAAAWSNFVAAQLGMAHHPGTTRDPPLRRSVEEIAAAADAFLIEYDKRFLEIGDG